MLACKGLSLLVSLTCSKYLLGVWFLFLYDVEDFVGVYCGERHDSCLDTSLLQLMKYHTLPHSVILLGDESTYALIRALI